MSNDYELIEFLSLLHSLSFINLVVLILTLVRSPANQHHLSVREQVL
jgi:hypothetical protein